MSMCAPPGQTVQWDASASQVAVFQTNGGILNAAGNRNDFNAPEYADQMGAGSYNPTGIGNTLTTGTSTNPYQNSVPDRKTFAYKGGTGNVFGPPQLSRGSVIANRSHDFLDTGASAYYFNAEDLWMWPDELAGPGSAATVVDVNSPSGKALEIATSTTFQVTTANVADLYIGSQLPAGKMRNYFLLRADSNTNFSVNAQAYESGSWTNIGCNTTFAVTTTYTVFSCDTDATGLTGDAYQIYLGAAASANVYVGYWGIRPYDSDPYGNYGVPGGIVNDNAGTTTPGLLAQSTGTAHVITYAHNQCPFVTDPPYNAYCDGSTDDSAAIQAAMDANGCIRLPVSTPANLQQCNFASALLENNSSLIIEGSGSLFNYTGTGTALSYSGGGGAEPAYLKLHNLILGASSASGTPYFLNPLNLQSITIDGVYDQGGPTGYHSIYAPSGLLFGDVRNSTLYDVDIGSGGGASFTNVNLEASSGATNSITLGYGTFTSFNVLDGGLNLTGSSRITFNSSTISGALTLGSLQSLNGSATVSSISGTAASGNFCYLIGSVSTCLTYGVPTYSNATTQLYACSYSVIGTSQSTAWVSDASSLTPGTAYSVSAGAGAITVQVQCTHSGSTYSWKTM